MEGSKNVTPVPERLVCGPETALEAHMGERPRSPFKPKAPPRSLVLFGFVLGMVPGIPDQTRPLGLS